MTDMTDTRLTRLNVTRKATHRCLTDTDTPLRVSGCQSGRQARMLEYSRMSNLPTATKTNHLEGTL
jgi:hypothetical protein